MHGGHRQVHMVSESAQAGRRLLKNAERAQSGGGGGGATPGGRPGVGVNMKDPGGKGRSPLPRGMGRRPLPEGTVV